MDIGRLTDKAKQMIEERGGTEALKEDAQELKEIAQSDASLSDKAKQAVEALKDPGRKDEPDAPAEPAAPTEPAASAEPESPPAR